MEVDGKRWILHPSRTDKFLIWNLSDLHIQSRACAEGRLQADIETIRKDPFSFWFGGGDYADFIGYSDKRFDPDVVAPWISVKDLGRLGQAGMHRVRDIFAPIKHKCMGLLIGNHEKRYELKTENDGLHGWLCEELGVRNLEYCAFFDIVFVRDPAVTEPSLHLSSPHKRGFSSQTFRVFAHHGAGYAQTPGGKLNRLVQFMMGFDADVYFCGHVHDKLARPEPAIGADVGCKNLIERVRLGVISGSYLRTYAQHVTTYGEMAGYRPTNLGAASVEICPETREMTAKV